MYLSIETKIWLRYSIVPSEEMQGKIDRPLRSYAKTIKISGDGIWLAQSELDVNLSIGMTLELEMEIPNYPRILLAIGKVHRIEAEIIYVKLLLIGENDRDELIRYILREEQLQKTTSR